MRRSRTPWPAAKPAKLDVQAVNLGVVARLLARLGSLVE